MKINENRFLSLLLSFALCLSLLPWTAAAANGAYTVQVRASLNGADIYVDGAFTDLVTPAEISCEMGSHRLEVRLPGYVTAEQTVSGNSSIAFDLQPELCPPEFAARMDNFTVANEADFAAALLTAKNRSDDRWTVIRFSNTCERIPYPSEWIQYNQLHLDDSFTNLTIDGRRENGMVISPAEVSLRVYGQCIRLVGIDFESGNYDSPIVVRAGDQDTRRIDVRDVYILGCRFADSFEVGIANCGSRGYAAKGYGEDGTFNVSNLVIAGNSFNRTSLFSFAGAGDEDYNVVDGYTVCGNTFTDGGIGLLASDAHSWYVHGYDGNTEPAYCEYNIFQNVLISGNSITYTENTPAIYSNIISMQAANLGNSHSTLQDVLIRNNSSRILGGDSNLHSSVTIGNVSVTDGYEDGKSYNAYVKSGMEHTDYNTTRNVVMKNNDFQLGAGRALRIFNVDVNTGGQCGSHNEMSGILVENNRIETASGVSILNYQGTYEGGLCEDNRMHHITFSGNTVTRSEATYSTFGVLAATASITSHGMKTGDYPAYSGTMETIRICGNTVFGFEQGIVAAAAYEDYVEGAVLSDVTISGNTIETKNYHEYPILDMGIVVSGAASQCNGEGSIAPRASKNCIIDNVTVSDNDITALCGLSVTGLLVTEGISYPSTGNTAKNVTAEDNRITQRERPEQNAQTTAGLLTADVAELWFKLGFNGKDKVAYVGGNSVVGFTENRNRISGFSTPKALYGGLHIGPNESGWELLSDSTDTNRAVKAPLHDLWVYRTTSTHTYVPVITPPTCTERGYTTHACSCGASYVDTYVDALGHSWDEGKATPPTCVDAGITTFTCTRCEDSYVDTYADALGHDFSEWTETEAATCTEKGAERRDCSRCEHYETREVEALGHNYKDTVTTPTCTEQGYTTHTCTRCEDSYVDTYVDALGHAWDDGVVTKQPTATENGVKTFTCTRCGETRTEPIPATGDEPCDGGEDCPSAKFVDVNPKVWYHPYVDYAVEHGLFGGTSENTFEPETAMTRAMLVTVLWRYEGQPKGYENPFVDVNAKSGSWYIDAVAWAAANNIVGGVGNGKFDPEGKITREQMATILFRYANWKGIDTSKRGDLNTFPDGGKTASWAKEAMQWAVGEKIINGSDGKLLPQGSATRAQVATILVRFIENIVNE